jgi:hypothetical protein
MLSRAMATLPSGTVTFAFTDVEGSTRLLRERPDDYARLLAEHQRIVRGAFAEEAAALAQRALAGGLLAERGPDAPALANAVMALIMAERFSQAERVLAETLAAARAKSSPVGFAVASAFRALLARRRGAPIDAEGDARAAIAAAAEAGWGALALMALAFLIDALVDRGQPTAARKALARHADGEIANGLGPRGAAARSRARRGRHRRVERRGPASPAPGRPPRRDRRAGLAGQPRRPGNPNQRRGLDTRRRVGPLPAADVRDPGLRRLRVGTQHLQPSGGRGHDGHDRWRVFSGRALGVDRPGRGAGHRAGPDRRRHAPVGDVLRRRRPGRHLPHLRRFHIRADDFQGRSIGSTCGRDAWALALRYFG